MARGWWTQSGRRVDVCMALVSRIAARAHLSSPQLPDGTWDHHATLDRAATASIRRPLASAAVQGRWALFFSMGIPLLIAMYCTTSEQYFACHSKRDYGGSCRVCDQDTGRTACPAHKLATVHMMSSQFRSWFHLNKVWFISHRKSE